MKQLNPNLNITVLEKYEQYQRTHTLVIQTTQLEALMKATHSEGNPVLVNLLAQLKEDPHIRTNVLQKIFTELAQGCGVDIQTRQKVKEDNFKEMLSQEYPNVRLVAGADGTHGVVSPSLFSKDNQVKHQFDYVLQFRYDIEGEEKSSGINIVQFYQKMSRKGLIANEYVGHFAEGKTPVTMQMMISKEDFLSLQQLTSKKPLKPYAEEEDMRKLPLHLQSFVTAYLKNKVADTEQDGQKIDKDSVRISVNEAPATYARKVVNQYGKARVVLEGDAALGLSYFKGLNAGFEASARFLTAMEPVIKDSFNDVKAMDEQLDKYQSWFVNDFSPKKVREVGQYSFWQIRSFMHIIKAARYIKGFTQSYIDEDYEPELRDYFKYYQRDPLTAGSDRAWKVFPHRDYDLVEFAQFAYVPPKHTAKKIAKIFVDYFKPYKSNAQLLQDFQQPLVGMVNFFVGLIKTVSGVFTLKIDIALDGLSSMARGLIELVTTPLTWLLKPISRGITTFLHGGFKKIEENTGIQNLAHYGKKYLADKDNVALKSNKVMYEILAVCNDIHRKFDKSWRHGQASEKLNEEYHCYSEIRSDNVIDREKLIRYFSLFAKNKPEQEEPVSEPNANNKMVN